MKRGVVRALFSLLVACVAARAPAQDLQVIDLQYRSAEELIPIVQPLLEPGGVVTGLDDVLFVRTGPANFEQIRAAVAMLDRAPRQLTISVGQGTVRDVDAAAVEGSATIGDGDSQVGVNRPPAPESGVQVEARARRQQADLHNLSSVRALEGTEVWIAVGQSVPLTETQVTRGLPGGIVRETTTYRDVSSGFYATARVNGDRVTLEISPRQQRYRPASGVVDTQGATTQITARLGEWFELGAVQDTGTSSTGGLLVWGRRSDASRYSAWVKVEEIR